MKIDFVKTIIAIALSALLAYACYEICKYEQVQWVITIGAFFTIAIPALFALGVIAKAERSAIVLSILSWVILFVEIITNGVFAFLDFCIPVYVVLNGVILLIYVLVYNSIYKRCI